MTVMDLRADTATAAALRKSAVSRYLQLAGHFRSKIAQGEWPVGDRIPTVMDLAEECGVAGVTVRRALDQLAGEKLIERFRAKGTFVCDRPARDVWCAVQTDWSGLLIARYSSRIEILADDPSPPPAFLAQDDWPGRPAALYRRLHRRYWRDGVAFMVAHIYIDETAYHALSETDLQQLTAMRLVADLPDRPIAVAEQELTVTGADLIVSDLLSVPLGAPMARVIRLAVDAAGVQVLVADGVYRGDTVRLRVTLK